MDKAFMKLCWCLAACFRWETIILISMYGIYIIIMKWVLLLSHFHPVGIKPPHTLCPLESWYPFCVFLLCRFNRSLYGLVERHCSRAGQPCLSSLRRTTAVGSIGDCDNDMVPLKPGAGARVCTCAWVHPKYQNIHLSFLICLWAGFNRPTGTV